MKSIRTQIEALRGLNIKEKTELELEEFLPTLGMNGELLHEMPSELSQYYGKGLSFWQYPNQFSKLLKKISEYEINSYLEIGSRWGGTFIIMSEILRNSNPNCKLFTCDPISESDILKEYREYSSYIYFQESSHDQSFLSAVPEKIDLVFVDGDHSYDAVRKDFENFKGRAKYMMFHDIASDACPDTVRFWNEIKDEYEHYEYIDQYKSVTGSFLGIGLIIINQ